jgi:D-3-phosphoglycerate dehydrogenase / 2-oxoglutarate reductase
MSEKRKVAVRVPKRALDQTAPHDWSYELEALEPIADIVEVEADTRAEFIEGVRDADAIMTTWGVDIDKETIDALQKCVVIGVGSVGVDMVDVAAATAAGIVVTNVPDVFIEEVADHAMMLLLDAARMTPAMTRLAAEGRWLEGRHLLARRPRLLGQTLGLYGFGNVARCTARRAKAFGLHLIAHDPYVSELEITGAGAEPVGFCELLERSDFVSIHTPHNAETERAFNAAAFSRMKPTAILINTARGSIVDEEALIAALQEGTIAGAGLDVLAHEPPEPGNPLLTMPGVVVTPHVASATTRMRPETRRRAGREVAMVLRGRWPLSCVNPSVLPRASLERWQPYPMNRGPSR